MRVRIAIAGAVIGTAAGITIGRTVRWWRTWGFDPIEAAKALPGDDLVPTPTAIDTRGITIDAPPDAVWPWLVQMGYGRGGWYSYDQLDMRGESAESHHPGPGRAHRSATSCPTSPDSGFAVRVARARPGARPVSRHRDSWPRRPRRAVGTAGHPDIPAGLAASGRDPAARRRRTSRPAGPSSSSRWMAAEPGSSSASASASAAAGPALPGGRPGDGLRRLRDDAAPDARHACARGADGGRAADHRQPMVIEPRRPRSNGHSSPSRTAGAEVVVVGDLTSGEPPPDGSPGARCRRLADDGDRHDPAPAPHWPTAPWRSASGRCRRRGSAASSTSRRRWTTSSASGWASPTSTRPRVIVEAGVESLREGRTHYTSQLRDARASARAGAPPRGALRRPLRPRDRDPDHGRRVGGGGPRPAGHLRPGRRGHPPRAVVRRLRARRSSSPAVSSATSPPASRTTSRSTRPRSRRRSRRGPRRSSSATRATRPARSCPTRWPMRSPRSPSATTCSSTATRSTTGSPTGAIATGR